MKRAVVLGGGGARGPYHIGVWQALREMQIDYHIVTGTSVGALNAGLMAQQDFERAKNMWLSLTTHDVIAQLPPEDLEPAERRQALRTFLREAVAQGGLDVSPLEEIVRSIIDEEKLRASPIEYGLVTTRYPIYKPVQLLRNEIPQGEIVDYMLASAAYFPFFPHKTIEGVRYIDGAFSDLIPAKLALRCGAQELLIIDLDGNGIVHPLRTDIPVTYIRCHWDLGQIILFDPEKAKRNLQLGYLDGLKAYRRLEGSAYAFLPGQTRANATALREAFRHIFQRTSVNMFRSYWHLPQLYEALRTNERRFVRRRDTGFTAGRALTAAAEITGELLGLAPDAIYTFADFNDRLLSALYDAPVAAKALTPSPFAKNGAKPRRILARLYRMLHAAEQTGSLPDAFWGLAAVAPHEFVAANYLLALHIQKQL